MVGHEFWIYGYKFFQQDVNKYQLSQMDPRNALPYTHRAVDGVGAQQDRHTKVIGQTSTGASSVNLAQKWSLAFCAIFKQKLDPTEPHPTQSRESDKYWTQPNQT